MAGIEPVAENVKTAVLVTRQGKGCLAVTETAGSEGTDLLNLVQIGSTVEENKRVDGRTEGHDRNAIGSRK